MKKGILLLVMTCFICTVASAQTASVTQKVEKGIRAASQKAALVKKEAIEQAKERFDDEVAGCRNSLERVTGPDFKLILQMITPVMDAYKALRHLSSKEAIAKSLVFMDEFATGYGSINVPNTAYLEHVVYGNAPAFAQELEDWGAQVKQDLLVAQAQQAKQLESNLMNGIREMRRAFVSISPTDYSFILQYSTFLMDQHKKLRTLSVQGAIRVSQALNKSVQMDGNYTINLPSVVREESVMLLGPVQDELSAWGTQIMEDVKQAKAVSDANAKTSIFHQYTQGLQQVLNSGK